MEKREKAVLAFVMTWNAARGWWAESVWLIGTDKYMVYSEGHSGVWFEVKVYNPLCYEG